MRRWLILLFPLSLAACGRTAVNAPGLGPRPVESVPIPLPDAASEPAAPGDPALAPRLAAIVAEARAAHARFEAERRAAAPAIARGRNAAEGSDAWLAAQQALSALGAQAGAVREQAGAVDALRLDPAFAGAVDRAAIEAAAAEIETLAEAERAGVAP